MCFPGKIDPKPETIVIRTLEAELVFTNTKIGEMDESIAKNRAGIERNKQALADLYIERDTLVATIKQLKGAP